MNVVTNRYVQLIKQLTDDKIVKDGKDFALTIGVSVSSITEISKGRSNVGLSAIQKTVSAFPDVNLDWLFTGEGEIFNTKTTKNLNKLNVKDDVKEIVKEPKLQKSLTNKEIFNTKTTKKVVISNDHLNDHLNDHERKLQKRWSNQNIYDLPVADNKIAEPDGEYHTQNAPPVNCFTGFTQDEVEKRLSESYEQYLFESMEQGRLYPAAIVEKLLLNKDERIIQLQAEVARLKEEIAAPKENKQRGPKNQPNIKIKVPK